MKDSEEVQVQAESEDGAAGSSSQTSIEGWIFTVKEEEDHNNKNVRTLIALVGVSVGV